ncbi:MAG TPA: Ig-like domain-containing protein [Terriglobales bacterium]
MNIARRGRYTALSLVSSAIALVLLWSGCNGFFVSGSTLNSITVTPTSIFLTVGQTKQFSASGTTVDGDTQDVTSSAKWTSSSSAAATVDAGLVTAVATGNSTITASQDGVNGTGSVIVNSQDLSSLAITPSNPSVSSGSTVSLTATGTFADNSTKNLTNFVSWTSGTTSVATVSTTGVVTGVSTGTSTITATVNTQTGTVTTNVTVTVQ